jgi:amino acid exporter
VLAYLALGLFLGAGSSVMPGPCGLAVMNAASRRSLRRAVGVGAGAAFGDATYASLGLLGVGPLLSRFPSIPPVLQAVSGVALVAYGAHHLLGPRAETRVERDASSARGELTGGILVGIATLLSNPGALVTWVLIVGSLLANASPVEAWSTAIGIGAGSFAWFSLMATLTHRGLTTRGALLARITTVVSSVLVVGGLASLLRAAQSWVFLWV